MSHGIIGLKQQEKDRLREKRVKKFITGILFFRIKEVEWNTNKTRVIKKFLNVLK